MLRQLPPTITADATPDWLPVGWIVHSTVLKRGRQTKLKSLQDRETASERPSWLPDERKAELGIGSVSGHPYKMNVNTSNDFKTNPKETVVLDDNSMESEDSSGEEYETGCNEITYAIEEDEEDFSEREYVENVENYSNITSTPLRLQPERMQKLESRAKTQCVFEDEDMSSDSDNKLPEAEISKEGNGLGEARIVSNLVESFDEKTSHSVVVECDDKAREIPGLTGSLTVEINLDCEPASDSLVEKNWKKSGSEGIGTRNIEIIDLESDVIHISGESGDTSKEPLKAQAALEEPDNEWGRSVFFPDREAPSHSVLVFENSNARSSVEDLSNTIELGLNPQEKNISGSKKRKKNTETCSSTNTKKKGIEAPTKKLQKSKTPPSKPHGKKGSSSVGMDRKPDDWLKPCPNFPFEPLTRSFQVEDDSVIRMYLEQHFTAPGSADSNLPLPDFGLPTFSNIKISLNEEPASKKKKSPDPPCVQVASSSLPSCSSMGTSMLQTVAGH
ncbi:unnamed protein product [Arabidopsis arenosa]|uniref:Uncharacterized protein n=1 Tax=Arabidopsis arenosa TaxID=38785 RepID=A0A8S1ZMN2_ARAAE|nr:unnamed protein product [Arabidopsis arenosa]